MQSITEAMLMETMARVCVASSYAIVAYYFMSVSSPFIGLIFAVGGLLILTTKL
jgi:hypothetical protein